MSTRTLTSSIDVDRAETVARRIELAYELLDTLAGHFEDSDDLQAEAIGVGFMVQALVCTAIKIPESSALLDFQRVYRLVVKARKRLGEKATARELLTEIHLDQGKERRRKR